jgi:hypothetical protein
MAHPYHHAVKKWGGAVSDYLPLLRNARRASARGLCNLQSSGDSTQHLARRMVTGETYPTTSAPAASAGAV